MSAENVLGVVVGGRSKSDGNARVMLGPGGQATWSLADEVKTMAMAVDAGFPLNWQGTLGTMFVLFGLSWLFTWGLTRPRI